MREQEGKRGGEEGEGGIEGRRGENVKHTRYRNVGNNKLVASLSFISKTTLAVTVNVVSFFLN